MNWIRAHKPASAVVAVAGVALVAWLAFGLFGIQTLFIDDEVDEAGPVFESGAGSLDEGDATTTTTGGPAGPASSSSTEVPSTVAPAVEQVAAGTFVDRSHPATGRAVVLSDGAQTFVRFEEFETDNGPDLFVYLSRGTTAAGPEGAFDDDFVNLGALKGNVGDQNYEIPPEVNVADFSTVVVWCRQFAVAFGAADLS
jgi:hypothetical protein